MPQQRVRTAADRDLGSGLLGLRSRDVTDVQQCQHKGCGKPGVGFIEAGPEGDELRWMCSEHFEGANDVEAKLRQAQTSGVVTCRECGADLSPEEFNAHAC